MLNKIKLILLVLFIFSPLSVYSVIITEVQIEGEDVNDCYIKLYNEKEEDLNIEGYKLVKKTSSGREYSIRVFPSSSNIKKGSYFIWGSSRNEDFPNKINANVSSKECLSSDNSVALLDNEGNLINYLSWGEGESFSEEESKLSNGKIIKRKKEEGVYKNTGINIIDFYIYPPSLSPINIVSVDKIILGEKNNKNPLLISISLSIILAIIILYLKKNGRT